MLTCGFSVHDGHVPSFTSLLKYIIIFDNIIILFLGTVWGACNSINQSKLICLLLIKLMFTYYHRDKSKSACLPLNETYFNLLLNSK
jgi:hypothetical protein